jgi:hypothetical protein
VTVNHSEKARAGPGQPSLGAHVRAALILLHVCAVPVLALPAPAYIGSARMREAPMYRRELDAWSQRLRGVGVEVTGPQLERILVEQGRRYLGLRAAVVRPFAPYGRYLGVHQSWQMFSQPQTFPVRLYVEVRTAPAPFRPIYVQHSNGHGWRRSQFEHDRVRKLLGRIGRRSTAGYSELCLWIAREAATDFPDETHVRIRQYRVATLPPERLRAGATAPGKFSNEQVFELAGLR